jgi:hypothetical protein
MIVPETKRIHSTFLGQQLYLLRLLGELRDKIHAYYFGG